MFRHHQEAAGTKTEEKSNQAASAATNLDQSSSVVKTEASLKELMEKNLKWSQIIYEQNRKINNKLLWTAIAEWLKTLLILVPLVFGTILIGPFLKNVIAQYKELLGGDMTATTTKPGYFDNFFKILNLDPVQQQQMKSLLK